MAEESPGGLEILLGRIALKRGLVTAQQLKDALLEQSNGTRKPLGEILVSRGHLTDSGLFGLLAEQRAALDSAPAGSSALVRADAFLGRILVQNGKVTLERINLCLRLQADAIESGVQPVPRLGELLVEKGFATPAAVADALALQRKTILACKGCSRRYNATRFDPGRVYRCPECENSLEPLPALDDVRVTDRLEARPADPPPAKPAPAPTGTFELGKYTILRQIGEGGMGVVFEALDTTLHRKVALKMLVTGSDQAQAREDEQRFLREARMCARLPKHPHIMGVYEAGVIAGRRYIAMERLEGVSFDEWRKAGAPVRRQIEVLRDVALAAHHAHEHGVVHRDLKPENVLIDADGRPHIMDFGLAKPSERDGASSLTGPGYVVGTPGYMSPEQARGAKALDGRTDVYSMGVMLFEVLAGRMPFEGRTEVDVLAKILTEPIPVPSSVARLRLTVPNEKGLERICTKALAKEPDDRYTTARALAEDLTRWLCGEEVLPPPVLRHRPRRRLRLP